MRVLLHVATLLLGLVVGLAALVAHRTLPPAGLLVSAAASIGAGAWLLTSRRPALSSSYAAGWLAPVVLALLGRPEGDFVVAQDAQGLTLMGVGLVVLCLGVVGLGGRRDPTP